MFITVLVKAASLSDTEPLHPLPQLHIH